MHKFRVSRVIRCYRVAFGPWLFCLRGPASRLWGGKCLNLNMIGCGLRHFDVSSSARYGWVARRARAPRYQHPHRCHRCLLGARRRAASRWQISGDGRRFSHRCVWCCYDVTIDARVQSAYRGSVSKRPFTSMVSAHERARWFVCPGWFCHPSVGNSLRRAISMACSQHSLCLFRL